jgi:hypothetical protein
MRITTTALALAGTLLGLMQFPSEACGQVFTAATFGNQRRTIETGADVATNSELLSTIEGGLHVDLRPGFMVAPVAGLMLPLETGGHTSVFTELEVNHTFHTGGYAGTGVGVWAIGDPGHTAATVLIHFGAPLMMRGPGRAKLLFTYESRLFFGQLNNIDNNYQALVGFRYVFR